MGFSYERGTLEGWAFSHERVTSEGGGRFLTSGVPLYTDIGGGRFLFLSLSGLELSHGSPSPLEGEIYCGHVGITERIALVHTHLAVGPSLPSPLERMQFMVLARPNAVVQRILGERGGGAGLVGKNHGCAESGLWQGQEW